MVGRPLWDPLNRDRILRDRPLLPLLGVEGMWSHPLVSLLGISSAGAGEVQGSCWELMFEVLICGIDGNWEKWGGHPNVPVQQPGSPCSSGLSLSPAQGAAAGQCRDLLLHLLPTASPPSQGAPTPCSLPWVTRVTLENTALKDTAGESCWRTQIPHPPLPHPPLPTA